MGMGQDKNKTDQQNDESEQGQPRPDVTPDQTSPDPNEQENPTSSGPIGENRSDTPRGNVEGQSQR